MCSSNLAGPNRDNRLVVDAHCDTLSAVLDKGRPFHRESTDGHLDLPRLRRGGVRVQFFAAFVHPRFRNAYLRRALAMVDAFYQQVACCPGVSSILGNNDLEAVVDGGTPDRLGALLAVEGGEALEGSLAALRMLHRLGLRCLGLTWNGRNELADGVGAAAAGGGLTAFGRAVVAEMNRLGIVVDLAHIAERGFWEALEASAAPVIVSHANARARCDHPRNLTDAQIKGLAARGGVVGVTFVPDFVDPDRPSLERLLDHVEHIVQLAGPDCVGLGSDFDGFPGRLEGMEDAARLADLPEALARRRFSTEDTAKILGENLLRVLREVLP